MSIKLDSNEICNLLDALIGLVEPQADSSIDEKVKENLKTVRDIWEWAMDIFYYAAKHRNDIYDSSKEIGEIAYSVMLEWKDWLEQICWQEAKIK